MIPSLSPAVVHGDSLAYLTKRRPAGTVGSRWELGATGHGPAGPELAEHLCAQIRTWDDDRAAQPVITAYPIDGPSGQLSSRYVIDKQHIRMTFSWPGQRCA